MSAFLIDAAARWSGWLTTLLLYAMAAVPFAVWAGRSTHAASTAKAGLYPGHGRTFWFVFLPLALLLYGRLRGYDLETPGNSLAPDENGQLLFLTVPPCIGLVAGYCLGWAVARMKRG